MREQHAQITDIIQGPVELFVAVLQDMRSTPVQADHHCRGWRYFQYLADAKLREAAMREDVKAIIKRRNRDAFQEAAE